MRTLDPPLQTLLGRLRRRVRRYVVWDSVLAMTLLTLATFWLAFAVDYLPVRIGGEEMPRSARAVVLLIWLVGMLVIGWRWLVGRLRKPLPDDSLALLIERHHPELGGRLVTAVQLSESARASDSHSQVMLGRVRREAAELVDRVDFRRVFRWEPIRHKTFMVVPLLVAVVALAIAAPGVLRLAVGRLTLASDASWPRRAHLEMVGVDVPVVTADEEDSGAVRQIEFVDRVVRLARGSNPTLRIRAAGELWGHQIPEACTLTYEDEAGNRGQSNLRRVGRVVDGYQSFVLDGPPLVSLAESVELTIRGLDDRLTGFRIEAVDPPAIADMTLQVRYPEYLRIFSDTDVSSAAGTAEAGAALAEETGEGTRSAAAGRADQTLTSAPAEAVSVDQELPYQAGVRVREGSRLVLLGRSSRPLGELDVELTQESPAAAQTSPQPEVSISEDGESFSILLTDVRSPLALRMVPRGRDGISAQAPYRYFIGVVRDEPPETTMRLVGIGSAITPIARLPIEATATDDYGVESLAIRFDAREPSAGRGNAGDPEAAEEQDDRDGGRADDSPAVADPAGQSGDVAGGQREPLVRTPRLDRLGETELALDLRQLSESDQYAALPPGSTVQLTATAQDRFDLGPPHIVRGDTIRLQVVTPGDLLALLERRELEFRSRLEQAIDETQRLRQGLTQLQEEGQEFLEDFQNAASAEDEPPPREPKSPQGERVAVGRSGAATDLEGTENDGLRQLQRLRLRIRQAELQTSKTTDELAGIVAGVDDLLLEMINNRVDSVDRRKRLSEGVREPLNQVVTEPLAELRDQITQLERLLVARGNGEEAVSESPVAQRWVDQSDGAIETTDEVLLALGAVLEKMLDLESYNEILDLFRGLIDDQEKILEETNRQKDQDILDLFK